MTSYPTDKNRTCKQLEHSFLLYKLGHFCYVIYILAHLKIQIKRQQNIPQVTAYRLQSVKLRLAVFVVDA